MRLHMSDHLLTDLWYVRNQQIIKYDENKRFFKATSKKSFTKLCFLLLFFFITYLNFTYVVSVHLQQY